MNWRGNGAALDLVDELEACAARQRLDAQEHLAELAGAAGLLLVPVVAVGPGADGLAVGDPRRLGLHLDLVALLHALQHHAQVQFAEAADDGLVEFLVVLDAEAGVLLGQPVQRGGELLLLAAGGGFDGQAEHRLREVAAACRWMWSSSWLSCSTASKWISSTLATAAMSPGTACVDLDVVLALQLEQMPDLERLLAVVDEQLRVASHGALVDAEHAELADEGVVDDLEDVGDDVRLAGRRRGAVDAAGGRCPSRTAADWLRRVRASVSRTGPAIPSPRRRCARRRSRSAPGGLRAGTARRRRGAAGRRGPVRLPRDSVPITSSLISTTWSMMRWCACATLPKSPSPSG